MIRLKPYVIKETNIDGESYTFSISRFPEEKTAKLFESVKKKIGYVSDEAEEVEPSHCGAIKKLHESFLKHKNKPINIDHQPSSYEDKKPKNYKDLFADYKKKLSAHSIQPNEYYKNVKPPRNSTSNIISKDDIRNELRIKHVKTFSTSNIGNILEVEEQIDNIEESPLHDASSLYDKEYVNEPYYDYVDLTNYFKMLSCSNSLLKTTNHPSFFDQVRRGIGTIEGMDATNVSTTGTTTSTDKHKIRKNTSSSLINDNSNQMKNVISSKPAEIHRSGSREFPTKNNTSVNARVSDSGEVFDHYYRSHGFTNKQSIHKTAVKDDCYNTHTTITQLSKSMLTRTSSPSNVTSCMNGSSATSIKSPVQNYNNQLESNYGDIFHGRVTSYTDNMLNHLYDSVDISTINDPTELVSLPKDTLVKYICKLQNQIIKIKNPEYNMEHRKLSPATRTYSTFKINSSQSILNDIPSNYTHQRRRSVFTSILHSGRQNGNISLDVGGTIIEEDDPLALLYKRRDKVPPEIKKQTSKKAKKLKNKK